MKHQVEIIVTKKYLVEFDVDKPIGTREFRKMALSQSRVLIERKEELGRLASLVNYDLRKELGYVQNLPRCWL